MIYSILFCLNIMWSYKKSFYLFYTFKWWILFELNFSFLFFVVVDWPKFNFFSILFVFFFVWFISSKSNVETVVYICLIIKCKQFPKTKNIWLRFIIIAFDDDHDHDDGDDLLLCDFNFWTITNFFFLKLKFKLSHLSFITTSYYYWIHLFNRYVVVFFFGCTGI